MYARHLAPRNQLLDLFYNELGLPEDAREDEGAKDVLEQLFEEYQNEEKSSPDITFDEFDDYVWTVRGHLGGSAEGEEGGGGAEGEEGGDAETTGIGSQEFKRQRMQQGRNALKAPTGSNRITLDPSKFKMGAKQGKKGKKQKAKEVGEAKEAKAKPTSAKPTSVLESKIKTKTRTKPRVKTKTKQIAPEEPEEGGGVEDGAQVPSSEEPARSSSGTSKPKSKKKKTKRPLPPIAAAHRPLPAVLSPGGNEAGDAKERGREGRKDGEKQREKGSRSKSRSRSRRAKGPAVVPHRPVPAKGEHADALAVTPHQPVQGAAEGEAALPNGAR